MEEREAFTHSFHVGALEEEPWHANNAYSEECRNETECIEEFEGAKCTCTRPSLRREIVEDMIGIEKESGKFGHAPHRLYGVVGSRTREERDERQTDPNNMMNKIESSLAFERVARIDHMHQIVNEEARGVGAGELDGRQAAICVGQRGRLVARIETNSKQMTRTWNNNNDRMHERANSTARVGGPSWQSALQNHLDRSVQCRRQKNRSQHNTQRMLAMICRIVVLIVQLLLIGHR